MSQRIGKEQLLAMLLARTPDHVLDAMVAVSPEDAADLAGLRNELARVAFAAEPAAPPPRLRARLLAARPRPRRPTRPVLVVLDMLRDHLTPGVPLEVPRARDIVPALARRIGEVRARGVPIIYACDAHAADDTDYAVWPVHALEGSSGAEVWPELAPAPGDHVIAKPTYSAFTRSTLGSLLDELGADEIILTGCATELGLAATATDALQRGFVVTIPPDCQAGMSELGEQFTMLTLSSMPPYDPRYLRLRV